MGGRRAEQHLGAVVHDVWPGRRGGHPQRVQAGRGPTGRETEPQPRVLRGAAGVDDGQGRLGVRAQGGAVDVQEDAAHRLSLPVVDATTGPQTFDKAAHGVRFLSTIDT
jgi:hypothetical protein